MKKESNFFSHNNQLSSRAYRKRVVEPKAKNLKTKSVIQSVAKNLKT